MAERLNIGPVPERYERSWLQSTFQDIVTWSRTLFRGKTYTVTNLTETRAIDANAATLDETRKVLATLLDDLQNGRFPQKP